MKFADIKELSRQELAKKRQELRQEMFQAKMKNGLGQLANPLQIRHLRRDLARVATAIAAQKKD